MKYDRQDLVCEVVSSDQYQSFGVSCVVRTVCNMMGIVSCVVRTVCNMMGISISVLFKLSEVCLCYFKHIHAILFC